MSPCCQKTLQEVPEAAFCTTCRAAIVRCTACREVASADGVCARCHRILLEVETGRDLDVGAWVTSPIRVTNQGIRALHVDAVRTLGSGPKASWLSEGAAFDLPAGLARDLVVGRAEALAGDVGFADLEVDVRVVGYEPHTLRTGAVVIGRARPRETGSRNVVIHGSVNVGPGGESVLGGDKIVGGFAPRTEPRWRTAPLTASRGETADARTPRVDRRVRLRWPNPRTGAEEIHHFGRSPCLTLGRKGPDADDPADRADLRWHAPLGVPAKAGPSLSRTAAERVSRRHAHLEVRSGRLWLTDLGSQNGTAVNGERLTSHCARALCHGDRITPWCDAAYEDLGAWHLHFKSGADGVASEILALHRAPTTGGPP